MIGVKLVQVQKRAGARRLREGVKLHSYPLISRGISLYLGPHGIIGQTGKYGSKLKTRQANYRAHTYLVKAGRTSSQRKKKKYTKKAKKHAKKATKSKK